MANPRPDPKRYTYVYHPSVQHKERWKRIAAKARTPISKFIIFAVDGVIDEDEEFQPQREVIREMEVLKKENKILHDDLRQKFIVIERYEAELKRYRSQSFLEEDYHGVRRYSKELVEILKRQARRTATGCLRILALIHERQTLSKPSPSNSKSLRVTA